MHYFISPFFLTKFVVKIHYKFICYNYNENSNMFLSFLQSISIKQKLFLKLHVNVHFNEE